MAKDSGAGAGTATLDDDLDDDDEQDLGTDDAGSEEGEGKGEEFDAEKAKALIAKQQNSMKKANRQAAELRVELKALKDKDLPEKERLTTAAQEAEERAVQAESRAQKLVIRTVALEAATTLGFKSPALAAKLLDTDDIEWDDDEPSNVTDLLKQILKQSPELKGRARRTDDDDDDDEDGADGGAGRQRKAKGFDMSNEIRRAAGRRG